MDFEIIRENFDRIRAEKGLKMKDLAAGLNVTPQSIYATIRGKNITVGTLQKIAALLGVEAWQLIKPHDNEQPQQKNVIICPNCGKPIFLEVRKQDNNKNGDI